MKIKNVVFECEWVMDILIFVGMMLFVLTIDIDEITLEGLAVGVLIFYCFYGIGQTRGTTKMIVVEGKHDKQKR